uniref:Hypothetical chloroplast RF20 n=1 Tax=Pedinomonas tuberculata TaxID=160064 RepID=A0A097KL67_9CHLO|nr:hypothetical chloroplast RF20 [Pedinomonas tuberculata]AIT93945.1 hypothetical chloroplast RF20 [Pedinomonas tuberculata]
MIFLPNLFVILKLFLKKLEKKNKFFQLFFINSFIFLFFGLFIGSLFGTFLDFPRSSGFWDGIIVITLLFICEIINFFVYTSKNNFIKILNYLKLGLLLALFIDAFKVGS